MAAAAPAAPAAAPAAAAPAPAKAADIKQNFLRLGDTAPDFKAECTVSDNTPAGFIEWHNYIAGKWAILFSHPKDFTPVCTTELGRVAQLSAEWKKRNIVVAGLSVDSHGDHAKWIEDINELSKCKVDYPLIADKEKKISVLYGMLDPTHVNDAGMPFTVRSVFLIGPDKKIKLMLVYPASTGRNFDEVLRCMDSLQLTAEKKVATPVDWKKGGECVILPTVSDEEANKLFPAGFRQPKKYIRLTPDPSAPAAAPAAAR
jgi:alkyl hydroperoxide reductase subunit AhpC